MRSVVGESPGLGQTWIQGAKRCGNSGLALGDVSFWRYYRFGIQVWALSVFVWRTPSFRHLAFSILRCSVRVVPFVSNWSVGVGELAFPRRVCFGIWFATIFEISRRGFEYRFAFFRTPCWQYSWWILVGQFAFRWH